MGGRVFEPGGGGDDRCRFGVTAELDVSGMIQREGLVKVRLRSYGTEQAIGPR